MLELSITVPSINLTGSLNVSTISLSTEISVEPSEGEKATTGGSESVVINVELEARIALF